MHKIPSVRTGFYLLMKKIHKPQNHLFLTGLLLCIVIIINYRFKILPQMYSMTEVQAMRRVNKKVEHCKIKS